MALHRRRLLALLAASTGTVAGCQNLPTEAGTPTEKTPTPKPASAVGCPDYDRLNPNTVICSQNPPDDSLVFRPEPETAELPTATIDCRLENTLDGPFSTNYYNWKLHRYEDGEWHHLGPYLIPMPLHRLPAGATHVRRLFVDNSDLARVHPPAPKTSSKTGTTEGESVSVAGRHGLGPGAYAVAIESDTEQENTIYSASFTLKGDAVPLVEPETVVERTRDGSHVTVRVEPMHDDAEQYDLTLYRRTDPAHEPHPFIDAQLYHPRFVGLRAALANLETGVQTITVEGDDSQVTRNLASGHGLRFIGYEGEVYELQLGAPSEKPATTDYDLTGGWPSYAADARNSGHVDATAPTRPQEVWRFESPGRLFDGPTVAGDLVFVPSTDGNLYALTARDGEEAWRFPVQGQLRVTPAVIDGTVYVAGRNGGLHAVDARTGSPRWIFNGNGEGFAISHPTVSNNTVYIGDTTGTLFAVDTATGKEKWQLKIGDGIATSPAVANETVYVGWRAQPEKPGGDAKGGLDAVSTDGTRTWRIRPGNVDGSATVSNGTVYAGSRGGLLAVDAATGDEQWTREQLAVDSPAVVDGVVYAGTRNGAFYALNAATGEEHWSFSPGGWADTAPAVGTDTAVFSSWNDYVYGVDLTDGSERWSVKLETPLSDPAIADGAVYVASNKSLVALRDP